MTRPGCAGPFQPKARTVTHLPLTIFGGYLGAGKTTLINRLLAEDHGLRLMVIVNDFRAINIDAALIESAEEDMIALSNGCVCCTISDDLTEALSRAAERSPRPDHLIVEASGIADPAAIAAAARAVPDLGYGGIVTLIDGLNIGARLDDPLTAPQISQQIRAADMLLLTKTDAIPAELNRRLTDLGGRAPTHPGDAPLSQLLFDIIPLPRSPGPVPHPAYTRWHHASDTILDRAALGDKLASRPDGLYRLKGLIRTNDGGYQVHAVGQHVQARRTPTDRTTLVALGPADRISPDDIERWWSHTP